MNRRTFIAALLLGHAALIPEVAAAAGNVWSRERTRREVRAACRFYRISKADTAWLVDAVDDIVYTGHHPGIPDKYEQRESCGDTHCVYGQHRGIVQFNRSWRPNAYEKRLARSEGHASDWRFSGRASIHRLVRVFRDGGKAAIRRHWAATLGR